MPAQLCPRLLYEVIAIKRSPSMHIRYVRRAHAVRQTDSILFAIYAVPVTASMGNVFARIHCRLFHLFRDKYLHPFLIAFLAVVWLREWWLTFQWETAFSLQVICHHCTTSFV